MQQILLRCSAMIAITSLAFGFYLVAQNQTTNASLVFTVSLLLLFFSQIERLESLKGFGIEAKVHKLDNKIKEADKINSSLRALTATLSQLSFELMSRIGRLNGPIGRMESLQIERSLLEQMRNSGISDTDILKAHSPYRSITAFDIIRPASQELENTIWAWNSEAQARHSQIKRPIDMTDPAYVASRAELQRLETIKNRLNSTYATDAIENRTKELRAISIDLSNSPEIDDFTPSPEFYVALDDHDYYIKNGNHKDIGRWINGKVG